MLECGCDVWQHGSCRLAAGLVQEHGESAGLVSWHVGLPDVGVGLVEGCPWLGTWCAQEAGLLLHRCLLACWAGHA